MSKYNGNLGFSVCFVLCSALSASGDGAPDVKKVNTAIVPVPGGSETWMSRHNAMNARTKEGHVDLVYIGDSIVASWKWDGEPVWDYY